MYSKLTSIYETQEVVYRRIDIEISAEIWSWSGYIIYNIHCTRLHQLSPNYWSELYTDRLAEHWNMNERIMPIHDIYLVTLVHLYLFQIDVFTEFHILGVDSENLQTTNSIRDTNVYFSVKSTKSSQGCVYAVRSVCSGHYNNMSSLLEAIHKCEKLWHDTPLDFTVRL